MTGLVIRQCWVAHDDDGHPKRSALDRLRLNGEPDVRRYVPSSEVDEAIRLLNDGDPVGAIVKLKQLAADQ